MSGEINRVVCVFVCGNVSCNLYVINRGEFTNAPPPLQPLKISKKYLGEFSLFNSSHNSLSFISYDLFLENISVFEAVPLISRVVGSIHDHLSYYRYRSFCGPPH